MKYLMKLSKRVFRRLARPRSESIYFPGLLREVASLNRSSIARQSLAGVSRHSMDMIGSNDSFHRLRLSPTCVQFNGISFAMSSLRIGSNASSTILARRMRRCESVVKHPQQTFFEGTDFALMSEVFVDQWLAGVRIGSQERSLFSLRRRSWHALQIDLSKVCPTKKNVIWKSSGKLRITSSQMSCSCDFAERPETFSRRHCRSVSGHITNSLRVAGEMGNPSKPGGCFPEWKTAEA